MKLKYKNWNSLKKAVKKGVIVNWKNENYIVKYWSAPNNEFIVHSKSNDYNVGLFTKNNEPIYDLKDFYTIQNKTMKLKKGSKEAREFMAKIRAKKKGTKKAVKKLSGVKTKPVKVGTKLYTKLVAQKKHFDDILKSELSGTKKKAVKKIAGEKHTDIKSHNYKISISGINKENLENLKERLKFDETVTMFLDDLRNQLKNKYLTIAQKNAIKKHIITSKKQLINNKKQISLIKQSIK